MNFFHYESRRICANDQAVAWRYRTILLEAHAKMLAAGNMETEYPVRGHDLDSVLMALIDMAPTEADIAAIADAADELAREREPVA